MRLYTPSSSGAEVEMSVGYLGLRFTLKELMMIVQ